MFKSIGLRIAQVMVRILPLSVTYVLARLLSDCQFMFSRVDRFAIRDNLRVIQGEEGDLDRSVREVFRNFGRYLVEFFSAARILKGRPFDERIRIVNKEALTSIQNSGRGAILFTGHLGSWELGAIAFSCLHSPLYVVALPHQEKLANQIFINQRRLKGDVRVIPSRKSFRTCLGLLKEGQVLGVVGDRSFGSQSTEVELFGRKTMIPKGPAMLAKATGAMILPGFLLRLRPGYFRMLFFDPIVPDGKSERQILSEMTAVLESVIRDNPEQWCIFRRFEFDENLCSHSRLQ